jgi:serine/threonine-protein kinase
MSDQGYARIHELFRRAMELEPEEWQAFLDRECGDDPAVRDQVEELLLQQGDTTVGPAMPTVAPSGRRSAPVTRPTIERHQAGEVFDERYRIVSMLGKGGMGEVYRAHDLMLDVPVAIKFVRSADAQLRTQLIREVRLAREVTHPTVCRVYDVGERDEQLYFTMEYVDGEDLSSLLMRIGRLPSDKVVEIAHQVCAGLAAAHAKGVIHRDLKPANIMIDGKGKVRITDFGIAVLGSEGGGESITGTPAYMAPEQLTAGELGPATDLYAVGLILYELITGRTAFQGSSLTEYLKLKLRSRPEALTETVQDIDPRLAQAITRAMTPTYEDRPQSAIEMAAALPGGDPLAMAVEAGVTPDPSLVAAVSVEHEVARRPLWALAACLPLLLVGVLLLADPSSHFDDMKTLKPPAVLADRAERMLDDLGYDLRPDNREWGFLDNPASVDPLWSVLFWYRERTPREAPTFVRQVMEAGALETDLEIPETISHEALLLMLDHTGRLAYLHEGPTFGSRFASAPDPEDRYDWPRILEMAGLDNAQLDTDAESILPVFSDGAAGAAARGRGGRL